MENNKVTVFKNSVNYGMILGFTLIIMNVISYLAGTTDSKSINIIFAIFQTVITIIGIVLGTRNLRNSSNDPFPYGKALGSGTLICLFASVILGIYLFIFYKFIDMDAIKKLLEIKEQSLISSGYSDDMVDKSMEFARKTTTPLGIFFQTLMGFTFMGFIYSLFTSIFLQKKASTLPWTQGPTPPAENQNNSEVNSGNDIDRGNSKKEDSTTGEIHN